MKFQILDPMIAQWTAMAVRLDTATEELAVNPSIEGLSRKDVERVRMINIHEGRKTLTEGALKVMRELRESLGDWGDPELEIAIGDLSAVYALEAHQIIVRRAENPRGTSADRDAKAFGECRDLAIKLREELLDSVREEKRVSSLFRRMNRTRQYAATRRFPNPDLRVRGSPSIHDSARPETPHPSPLPTAVGRGDNAARARVILASTAKRRSRASNDIIARTPLTLTLSPRR